MANENSKSLVLLSSPSTGCTARSNSILNRNAKLYSPKHALDIENLSSCYNSDSPPEEKPVLYSVLFQRKVTPCQIKIQFQGGFAGLEFDVLSSSDGCDDFMHRIEVDAEDTNELQVFDFDDEFDCTSLRLQFNESADFYGRITFYKLEVWGYETS